MELFGRLLKVVLCNGSQTIFQSVIDYVITCGNLAGPGSPDIWPNIILDVSVKVIF